MPNFKFSIRTLILILTLFALATWWISVPRSVAKQFVQKIQAGERSLAAKMFLVDGTAAMLHDTESTKIEEVTAWIPKVNPSQQLTGLLLGRKRIELTVVFQREGEEKVSGLYPLQATFRGISVLPAPLDHNFVTNNDFMEDR